MPNFNCFCIDLSLFSSPEEIRDFLISTDLQEKIDYKNLWDAKNGVFTNGEHIYKAWFDSVTFYAFAYTTETESKFVAQFVDYINNIAPLEYGDKVKTKSTKKSVCTSIDDVLDKINTHGFKSLSPDELEILRNQ